MAKYVEVPDDFVIKEPIVDGSDVIGFREIDLSFLSTADIAPVVHGKWIPTTCIDLQSGEWEKYRCSLCGRIEIVREPYCNCGAKMDLEE